VTPPVWIAVAALGGLGALARFALDAAVSERTGSGFPLGTLAVNLSGALTLGVLRGAGLGGNALLLAGTATLGSYTTFSTWMLETQRLSEERQHRKAAVNVIASLALGVAAAALGRLIGAQL